MNRNLDDETAIAVVDLCIRAALTGYERNMGKQKENRMCIPEKQE